MLTYSQNICGSGFFHHLNEADTEPSDSDTTDIPNGGQDHDNEKAGIVLPFLQMKWPGISDHKV